MQEEDKTTEQKAKANKIIRIRSALAAGTGLLPFPVLDAAGITGIQLWMIRDLSRVYGIPFRKHLAKSLIGSLLVLLVVLLAGGWLYLNGYGMDYFLSGEKGEQVLGAHGRDGLAQLVVIQNGQCV